MYSFGRRSTGRITPTRKLVKKGSSLRDLRPLTERVVLEKVLGVNTANGNSGLACNPLTGDIAYAAGCVIVIIESPRQSQSHIINSSRKTISSLAFSPDGKYLVSGESGHEPAVRVWDSEDTTHPQVSEMAKGHKHGIQSVAFSPNMKYVVSVGFQHDMLVNIWNWREGTTIACNKVSSKVNAISFSKNGDYFVTAGVRIVKFWYIDSNSATKAKKKIPLLGRPAILGEQRDNQFIDVSCGVGKNSTSTYTVTKSGLLCSINEKRLLDKWVEMRVNGAYSLTVNEHYIFCGCSDGIIRLFDSSTLEFIGRLPKPHCLGVDVGAGIDASHLLTREKDASYPDTIALALDPLNIKLTCIYNDHSIYIWDIKDIKKIGKVSSFLYHSSCIWGVEVYPEATANYQACLPYGSFLTCSSDGTVRVWNLETGSNLVKNIYSKELMRVLYTEKDLNCLKDTKGYSESKRGDSEAKRGIRCLKLCHMGQHLATGDRVGNIRVFDLAFMDELMKIEAHESEVLCIEYSTPESGYKLLASAGRDRLIHVFDCDNNFCLVQTIDDHSASITAIKFNVSESKDLQLISCAADKSVVFRSAQKEPELQFLRYTNVATKTTFYDMDIQPSCNYAVTAGQDRNLRVFDIASGKQTRSFKGSMGDEGIILKVLLDKTGFYAATSCSDKTLSLYDFEMGECVAGMVGHSEVATGIQFAVDCSRLITVSGDSCIFVWKLPSAFSQNMSERLDQESPDQSIFANSPLRRETYNIKSFSQVDGAVNGQEYDHSSNDEASPPDNDLRFSIGKLPLWAKKQVIAKHASEDTTIITKTVQSASFTAATQPAGKWGERFQQVSLKIQPESPISNTSDSPDRRRLTEIKPLRDHIEELSRTPLEKRCSNGSNYEDDISFQDASVALRLLKDDPSHNSEDLFSAVNTSRGSDMFLQTIETRTYVESNLVESSEKVEEIESKDHIIYYPAEEDGEVARSYDVKVRQDSEEEKGFESPNTESISRDDTDDKTGESLSDEDDLLTKEIIPKWDELAEDPAPSIDQAEVEDGKEFLQDNFECLGSTPKDQKTEFQFRDASEAVPKEPLPFDRNSFHRTSISARFILRSKQGSMKTADAENSQNTENGQIETKNVELEKRKEELALTKKRLEALGFNTLNKAKTNTSNENSNNDRISTTKTDTIVEKLELNKNGEVLQDAVTNEEKPGDQLQSAVKANSEPVKVPQDRSPQKTTSIFEPLPTCEVSSSFTDSKTVGKNTSSSLPRTTELVSPVDISGLEESPCISPVRVTRSPRGTVISSLEISNVHSKELSKGSKESENKASNTENNSPRLTDTTKDNSETSPHKRASELIAFFDPRQKHKTNNEEPTSERTRRYETRAQKSKQNEKTIVESEKIEKRPSDLPLGAKITQKNESRGRRSFLSNIRITKSKSNTSRRGSKGDLSKTKSCSDLSQELAKEKTTKTRQRRRSNSKESVEKFNKENKTKPLLAEETETKSQETPKDETTPTNELIPSPVALKEVSSTPFASEVVQDETTQHSSNLSELCAELNAALATPQHEPIQITLSQDYLLGGSNLNTSVKHGTTTKKELSSQITRDECREVVVDLVRAFERALECHSKILHEGITDDQQQVLSMLSATFSTIQESVTECKRDREQKTRSQTLDQKHPEIETKRKQTKDASQQTEQYFSQEEQKKIAPLLEKYSDLLLQKIEQKMNKH